VAATSPPTWRRVYSISFTGESGLGKSTLINTLFNTTLYPPKEPLPPAADRPKTVAIESIGAGTIFTSPLPPYIRISITSFTYRYRGERCSTSFNRCGYTRFR
jgi:septin family protein